MSNDYTVDSAIEAPIAETVGPAEVGTEIGEAPEVTQDYFSWYHCKAQQCQLFSPYLLFLVTQN